MENLFVLDAVNFLFRSYYALGPITNPKGESTGALYGFIRSVFKIIKDFGPKHLIAVFDGPNSSQKRKEIFAGYKINRAHMPEDLYNQLQQSLRFCELAGIPFLSIPGVEADDVMGSIAVWASQHGATTYICTSDKDLSQFVGDKVFVLNPHKDNLKLDREKVKEIYGVYPEQIVDLLSMMGDTSDNIPGLPGIGPKTASSLLEEFGSLDAILTQTDKISGKKRSIIEEGREKVLLSRQLAQIQTDVEFPQNEEFFRLKEPDLEPLKAFYQEMHFLSLLKDLPVEEKTEVLDSTYGVDETAVTYTLVNDEHTLKNLVAQLQGHHEICIDTETTSLNAMQADVVGIGLGYQPAQAWYIPLNGLIPRAKILEILKPLWEKSFFGHNIKYDLHALKRLGIEIKKIAFDTIIASYLLAPQKNRHGLDSLSLELFGKVKIPITDLIGKGKKQISMSEVPLEQVAVYCCEDVDYTIRLKKRFEKEIKTEKLEKVLHEIELPLLSVLFKMEEYGIFLDKEKMGEINGDLAIELEHLTREIYDLAGESFNLNSPRQLATILFEKMGIKPLQKTATGYSTSADVLEELKETSPIIPKILNYRTLEKLRSTYAEVLPDQINPHTGRIHCTFNQSVAATGRLSCQDPNLQNIPVRTPEGRRIRGAFRPSRPNFSFLSADYSQIELRLLAHMSEDPALIKAFQEGDDIHSFTASLVFNVPLNAVTSEMRHAAKAVNFGIIYGQQAFGLSKELGVPFEEAKFFIETYFARYKRIKEYLENCKEEVRRTGRALTLTGRQRPIPEIHNKNPLIRSFAERLAINTPLQGTAADLIKIAMIQIDRALKSEAHMILQIHDELIFEVPDTEIESLTALIRPIMQKVFQLKIPLVVDISIGKNWEEC